MWKITFRIFIKSLRFEIPEVFIGAKKIKDEFVNQPHSTKIVKIRAFFVFLKKSKILILVSNSSDEFLFIILITFFDKNEIRKVTVC